MSLILVSKKKNFVVVAADMPLGLVSGKEGYKIGERFFKSKASPIWVGLTGRGLDEMFSSSFYESTLKNLQDMDLKPKRSIGNTLGLVVVSPQSLDVYVAEARSKKYSSPVKLEEGQTFYVGERLSSKEARFNSTISNPTELAWEMHLFFRNTADNHKYVQGVATYIIEDGEVRRYSNEGSFDYETDHTIFFPDKRKHK